MPLPKRETAVAWVGRPLVDRSGERLGTCEHVYADDVTGAAEWAVVGAPDTQGRRSIVPLLDADADGDQVRLAVTADRVRTAPEIPADEHISADEEDRLYAHYGLSRPAESASVTEYAGTSQPATSPEGTGTSEQQPASPAARGGSSVGASAGAGRGDSVARAARTAAPALAGTAATVGALVVVRRLLGQGGPVRRGLVRAAYALHLRSRPASRRDVAAAYARLYGGSLRESGRALREGAAPVAVSSGRALKRAGQAGLQGTGTVAALGVMGGQRLAPKVGSAARNAGSGAARTAAVVTGTAATTGAVALHKAAELASTVGEKASEAGSAGRRTVTGAGAGAARTVRSAGGGARFGARTGARAGSRARAKALSGVGGAVDDVQHAWAKTTRRVALLAGMATGYLLGARAGRQRYEQLRASATELLHRPEVRRVTETVREQVGSRVGGGQHDDGQNDEGNGSRSGSTSGRSTGTGWGEGGDALGTRTIDLSDSSARADVTESGTEHQDEGR